MMLFLLALAAADPATIAPTTKWQVDYGANQCLLSRDYGAGADKVSLGLSPLPTSDTSEVVLLTQGNGPATATGEVTITLLPGGQPVSGTYRRGPLPKGGADLATMFFSGNALAGLDKASVIEVRLDTESHRLAVPGIAGAMAALSTCQDELLKSWGIDPAERGLARPRVQGNPAGFFGPDQYPLAAVRDHAQGRAVAVATIDAQGAVTECRVVVSSGSAPGNKILDATTCAIVRHKMQFTPALDKDGHPVAAHYILPVRWVMPNR